jgi:hypothetical protein
MFVNPGTFVDESGEIWLYTSKKVVKLESIDGSWVESRTIDIDGVNSNDHFNNFMVTEDKIWFTQNNLLYVSKISSEGLSSEVLFTEMPLPENYFDDRSVKLTKSGDNSGNIMLFTEVGQDVFYIYEYGLNAENKPVLLSETNSNCNSPIKQLRATKNYMLIDCSSDDDFIYDPQNKEFNALSSEHIDKIIFVDVEQDFVLYVTEENQFEVTQLDLHTLQNSVVQNLDHYITNFNGRGLFISKELDLPTNTDIDVLYHFNGINFDSYEMRQEFWPLNFGFGDAIKVFTIVNNIVTIGGNIGQLNKNDKSVEYQSGNWPIKYLNEGRTQRLANKSFVSFGSMGANIWTIDDNEKTLNLQGSHHIANEYEFNIPITQALEIGDDIIFGTTNNKKTYLKNLAGNKSIVLENQAANYGAGEHSVTQYFKESDTLVYFSNSYQYWTCTNASDLLQSNCSFNEINSDYFGLQPVKNGFIASYFDSIHYYKLSGNQLEKDWSHIIDSTMDGFQYGHWPEADELIVRDSKSIDGQLVNSFYKLPLEGADKGKLVSHFGYQLPESDFCYKLSFNSRLCGNSVYFYDATQKVFHRAILNENSIPYVDQILYVVNNAHIYWIVKGDNEATIRLNNVKMPSLNVTNSPSPVLSYQDEEVIFDINSIISSDDAFLTEAFASWHYSTGYQDNEFLEDLGSLKWQIDTSNDSAKLSPKGNFIIQVTQHDWMMNISVPLEIININDAPESIGSEIDLGIIEDGTLYSMDLSEVFFDIDGDYLTFHSSDLPIGFDISNVALNVSTSAIGALSFNISARDQSGLEVSSRFFIEVRNNQTTKEKSGGAPDFFILIMLMLFISMSSINRART